MGMVLMCQVQLREECNKGSKSGLCAQVYLKLQKLCLNPLSPDINMGILLTVLHTFLMELVRRICLNISLSLVITSFILIT